MSFVDVDEICVDTLLPDDLILVHEFGDHYSMQARKEMTVEGKLALQIPKKRIG